MKLDTIVLSTHIGYLQDFDRSKFRYARISNPNGTVVDNYSLANKPPFGLENLSINETFNSISLTVNSKILKENYFQGFNINTLDQLLCEINKTGAKLDSDFVLDSQWRRFDVTSDISTTKPHLSYMNSLNHLIAPRFYKTSYDSAVVFKEKLKQQYLYTTFYSKQYPSTQDKRFFKEYMKAALGFNESIRMETKLITRSTVRKYITGRKLPEILTEPSINPQVLKKIIGKQLDFSPDLLIEETSSTEEKNIVYAQYLFALYNGDRSKIVQHIKGKLGKRTKASYQLQQLDKYLAIIRNRQDSSLQDTIQELISSLAVAELNS